MAAQNPPGLIPEYYWKLRPAPPYDLTVVCGEYRKEMNKMELCNASSWFRKVIFNGSSGELINLEGDNPNLVACMLDFILFGRVHVTPYLPAGLSRSSSITKELILYLKAYAIATKYGVGLMPAVAAARFKLALKEGGHQISSPVDVAEALDESVYHNYHGIRAFFFEFLHLSWPYLDPNIWTYALANSKFATDYAMHGMKKLQNKESTRRFYCVYCHYLVFILGKPDAPSDYDDPFTRAEHFFKNNCPVCNSPQMEIDGHA